VPLTVICKAELSDVAVWPDHAGTELKVFMISGQAQLSGSGFTE